MAASSLAALADDEVLRDIWDGRVAIEFQLASSELSTLESPAPFYLSLPRYSYLPLQASSKVRKHFEASVPALVAREELWYSTATGERLPLKWHWPIGVLYDVYGGGSVPWPVSVHFQAFPSDRLLRCPDEETIKSHFLNTLKQANFLKHGNIKAFNDLSVAETSDLWAAVVRDEGERFSRVNRLLLRKEARSVAALPIRIAIPGRPLVQEPIAPLDPDGLELTLGSVLERLVPDAVQRGTPPSSYRLRPRWRLIVQGIQPPLEASAIWIALNLAAPDNFLYLCLLSDE